MWQKSYYPYVGYVLLCILGIANPFHISWINSVTIWDTLFLRFYGVSVQGGFSLLSFLFYVVVFMGLVYFFQVYITDYLSGRFYYAAIRNRSLYRLFTRLGIRVGVWAITLLVGLFLLTTLIGLASGQSLEPKLTVKADVGLYQVLYQFLINGWLQSMSGMILVFISAWLFKDVSYSLVILGLLVLAILPMFNVGSWLPAGLNSMGYISGQWKDLIQITAKLVGYLIIEISVVIYIFKKKDIALY
ncbi:hypothetical protein J2Z69_001845 [Paenibacillus shirakamiensis]|uniref:ABC transporter permease n=1 Tax=Paenibacillus shirakamiensis TaxID=1265935 RepID=A0ABS4JGG9_9BACL|nr:hypothetical protein [Paenibacillus shirakamiensis]MBP2000814.1 hypothetical protein [Paenibacillus shirakamiensis]